MEDTRHTAAIRVVSPAGPVQPADLEAGMAWLRGEGFRVETSGHALGDAGYLSGTDEERLRDLADALSDPGVGIVWYARGGYGTTRLLPFLEKAPPALPPKTIAGYSDATALFNWAGGRAGLRCLYAPVVQELARPGVCVLPSLLSALRGSPSPVPGSGPDASCGPFPVRGGCLSILAATLGTPWAMNPQASFLFLEDVGEPLYRIDRMLTQLSQARWFDLCAGVLLGSFSGLQEGESEAEVSSRVRELTSGKLPVIRGLPVGHTPGKHTLPLGIPALWDGELLTFPAAE